MNDIQYSVLGLLYNSPHRTSTIADIANSGIASPPLIYVAISDLTADKLIKPVVGSCSITLTDKGRRALDEARKNDYDQTKLNADAGKNDRTSKIVTVITVSATVIATLAAIIELVLRFF